MVRAVFFDMNGIIIDDDHIHELAFKETLRPFGINLNHDNYLEYCAGKTDKAGYESISEKFGIDLPINKLLIEKSQQYLNLFPQNKKSYPGVIKLINKLSESYRLALTSSSSRAEVTLILNSFEIADFFEVTVSGDDVSKGKPDPEPYIKTAELMRLNPTETVVIEDSKSGVISAKAANCYCIGVTTTHSKESLVESDFVVDTFEEIEPIIKQIK